MYYKVTQGPCEPRREVPSYDISCREVTVKHVYVEHEYIKLCLISNLSKISVKIQSKLVNSTLTGCEKWLNYQKVKLRKIYYKTMNNTPMTFYFSSRKKTITLAAAYQTDASEKQISASSHQRSQPLRCLQVYVQCSGCLHWG